LAFLVEKGTFTKRTDVGTDVISHGLGESPKILIFWTTAQTATGFAAHVIYSIGFSDGTRHKCVSMVSEDAQGTSDSGRRFSDVKCIHILVPNGGAEAEADISAVSSTNFTVNWTTNGGGADIIHYQLFSGSDITVSEVGQFTTNTVSGNQTISHTNSPIGGYDVYMFLLTRSGGTAEGNGAELGIGFASGAANEAALTVVSEPGRTTTATHRIQRDDRCIVLLDISDGEIRAEAEFVSKTTSDFTINWVDPSPTADVMAFMGIKGGLHHVNTFTQPASTGTQDITDAGFQPKGYMLASRGRVVSSSSDAIHRFMLGATDGINQGVLSSRDENAVTTSNADTHESTADVMMSIANTDVIQDEANHDSMLPDGFRIDWTDIGSNAEVAYWAFGDAVLVKVTPETLDLVEATTKIRGLIKIAEGKEAVSQ